MEILIVGAGALGGYYGGKLLQAGRNVTFLVRPNRAKQLAATGGLVVTSPHGDFTIANPPLVTADQLKKHYDLLILSCKSTGLASCIQDMAPAVGPDTMILPILNGMAHINMLIDRFGKKAVLGGRALIFATLDPEGRVLHQGPIHNLDFGELDGSESARIQKVAKQLCNAGFDAKLRTDMMHALWQKWVMIATTAGGTSLMRASIGEINRAGGTEFMLALLKENATIATLNGYPPGDEFMQSITKTATDPTSPAMASLAKDIDKNLPIEGDHIIGDLLRQVPETKRQDFPLLSLVNLHLKAYEERRNRQ